MSLLKNLSIKSVDQVFAATPTVSDAVMIVGGTFLAALILAVDLSLPLGVAGGVPYVALVCLGWYGRGARQIVALGVVSSLLTVVGYLYSPDGGAVWVVLANRFLAFAAIWVMTAFLIVAKRGVEKVASSQQHIVELARFPDENPNPVLRVKPDGTVLYANSAAREAAELFAGDGQDTLAGGLAKEVALALETGSPREIDFVAGDRTLSIAITPVAGVFYVYLYGRDITLRKKAEEQLRQAHDKLEQRVRKRTKKLEKEITAHKHTEEALRASEEQIRLITDALPILIAYVDKDFQYRFANKTAANWNACQQDDLVGRHVEEVLGLTALEILSPYAQKALSGQEQAFEETIAFCDGQTRDISGNYVPHLREDGSVEGIFIMAQDITARKRAERELEERVGDLQIANAAIENQGVELVKLAEDLSMASDQADAANRAKSEFLASMSHELRTPLNAIIGFSEIMNTETLGPIGSSKYRDYAGDIHESGQHLLKLINDILDLSKIESGNEELHEEDVVVPVVTESALRLVRQRAEQHGVGVELKQPDGLPALRADERRLKQIMVNLLTNAIKFTEPGGMVTLKIWCCADSGYVFQVIDTGIGIAREDISKALSEFGQIESSVSHKHVGTGLGLPLTKSLVELHGGYLDLQSEIGIGTTVTVRFPAERIVDFPTKKAPCSAA